MTVLFVGGPWDGYRKDVPPEQLQNRYYVSVQAMHGPTGDENAVREAVRYDLHTMSGVKIYLVEPPVWEKDSIGGFYDRLIKALAAGYRNV